MNDVPLLLAAALALGAGTYVFRFVGPVLRARITFPQWAERLLEASAVVLLVALVATTGLAEGRHFAGLARPAGVLVGALLAWRKAPFLLVIVCAAASTALLRLCGVE